MECQGHNTVAPGDNYITGITQISKQYRILQISEYNSVNIYIYIYSRPSII